MQGFARGLHGKLSNGATVTHFRVGVGPCRTGASAAFRVRPPLFETGRMRNTPNPVPM